MIKPIQSVASPVRPTTAKVQPVPPPVAEGVDSLSLQTRVDLSQKAQAAPPPPPPAETKKPKKPRSEEVTTQDFTGRTCSGTLTGPLLMEDPLAELPQDAAALQATGKFFALLDSELLTAERSQQPLAEQDGVRYYGVQEGVALVTHSQPLEAMAEERQLVLPDGSLVSITQSEGMLSLYLPAESLSEMVRWGQRLLAEA